MGCGEHDAIRLHRVVKERHPYRPIRTRKNIFLLHGDAVGFVKFLFGPASPHTPDSHALAIYLAQEGVDVWGMDQNWALVPMDTSDFSFMADWGIQNQVDNLRSGLAVARISRLFTGNGFGKMHLLGYSSGVMTGFAYLNEESQRPRWQRHVKGFVPADLAYKLGPEAEEGRLFTCGAADEYRAALEAGTYEDPTGIVFDMLGALAETDPNGPSPIIEGVTNLDAMFFFTTQTHLLLPINDWWHYFAPILEEGQAVNFNYTPMPGVLDFLQTASPYEALRFVYDYMVLFCDEEDVPYDDHLADITVPILNVAPAGGVGETSYYGLTLLGSTDVTNLNIQLQPDDQHLLDFGHIDLWTADNAAELVWQPIFEWIAEHRGREENQVRTGQTKIVW